MTGKTERTFERLGLGYKLSYPTLDTDFIVDSIARRSEGVYADLSVYSNLEGARALDSGLLHTARINLSATATRSTVGKYLASRVGGDKKDELDWIGMVAELCMRALEAEADNEPTEYMNGASQSNSSKLLIRPFLPLDMPTVLFGDGMAGKSALALAFGLTVCTGHAVIPGLTPRLSGNVLYLDWETDFATSDTRHKALLVGAGLGPLAPETFFYRRCRRPLADLDAQIARSVDQRKIALVIVDSMTMAIGTSRDGSAIEDSVLRFYTALGHLNATSLIVDHVSKGGDGTKPYGSVFRSNWARATWNLKRLREDDDGVHIQLSHEKHNTTREFAPVGMTMRWENDDDDTPTALTIRQEPLSGAPTGHMTQGDQIEACILAAGHPLRVSQIANRCGLSPNAVSVVLHRGDRFVSLPTGDWSVRE